jgi:hypothetical protein
MLEWLLSKPQKRTSLGKDMKKGESNIFLVGIILV